MSQHRNYFEVSVDTNYDLGLWRGEVFGKYMRKSLEELKEDPDWERDKELAKAYVPYAAKAFPDLIEEVHGYAEGARVCFEDAWRMIIEDELIEYDGDRCSTMITNGGKLIAHNEDWWEDDAADTISVVHRNVGGFGTLELFYMNTLGGNSLSINSHGYVQAVNSLAMTDHQIGIPRNVVCRWLSETNAPDKAFQQLKSMKRASGYHHNLINKSGRIWSIECSATREVMTKPRAPYVHTNHYLTRLSRFEDKDYIQGTHARYQCALKNTRDTMSVPECKKLLGDVSEGDQSSIFNEWTVACVIVDFEGAVAHIWLRRESEKGWVPYDLKPLFESDVSHQETKASR